MPVLHEWNVVVSVRENGYSKAKAVLRNLGVVGKTPYFNILVMRVNNVREMLETLQRQLQQQPEINQWISHVVPVTTAFHFNSPEEFEIKAKQAVLALTPALAGKQFYVRLQRRGFKDRIESSREERLLGEWLLEELAQAGTPGSVGFENPDAILVIETVGQQAGLAVWTREELARYPLLHIR